MQNAVVASNWLRHDVVNVG